MKTHDLYTITAAGRSVSYFYEYAGNDRNGNARYNVHIIDTARGAVYEKRITEYRSQIAARVVIIIETEAK